jgi:hypothetical protein
MAQTLHGLLIFLALTKYTVSREDVQPLHRISVHTDSAVVIDEAVVLLL